MRGFVFQLRGAQILDAVRLHKNGFPESIGYSEFWRKFHLLSTNGEKDGTSTSTATTKQTPALGEIRGAVERLLVALEIDRSAVRMGNTQVRKERREGGTIRNEMRQPSRYERMRRWLPATAVIEIESSIMN